MKKFVALYGGSFNLSTLAHRAVGAAVRDLVQPDEVWYLVSPQNPHKVEGNPNNPYGHDDHMADFRDRLEMAKLNVCGLAKLVVTDIEKEISEKTGSTASADTLRELIARFPDTRFAWVMGSDTFVKLHTWHNFEFILRNVPIIVLPRAGSTQLARTCPAAQYAECPELAEVGYLKIRNGWHLLKQFPEGSVSATKERDRIASGERPRNVHPAVADYIARQGLHF